MRSGRRLLIGKLLLIQLIVTLVIAMVVAITINHITAFSVVLGGLASLIPTAIFARKMFQHQGAQAARNIVKGFYQAEVLKMISATLVFIVIFRAFKINPIAFFLTYIGVQWSYWFLLLLPNTLQNRSKSE